jgi:hypothetical protein
LKKEGERGDSLPDFQAQDLDVVLISIGIIVSRRRVPGNRVVFCPICGFCCTAQSSQFEKASGRNSILRNILKDWLQFPHNFRKELIQFINAISGDCFTEHADYARVLPICRYFWPSYCPQKSSMSSEYVLLLPRISPTPTGLAFQLSLRIEGLQFPSYCANMFEIQFAWSG